MSLLILFDRIKSTLVEIDTLMNQGVFLRQNTSVGTPVIQINLYPDSSDFKFNPLKPPPDVSSHEVMDCHEDFEKINDLLSSLKSDMEELGWAISRTKCAEAARQQGFGRICIDFDGSDFSISSCQFSISIHQVFKVKPDNWLGITDISFDIQRNYLRAIEDFESGKTGEEKEWLFRIKNKLERKILAKDARNALILYGVLWAHDIFHPSDVVRKTALLSMHRITEVNFSSLVNQIS